MSIIFDNRGEALGSASYIVPDIEELACEGVLPSGPVCPWPQPIVTETLNPLPATPSVNPVVHDTAIKASISDMAKGLFKNVGYAIKDGRVNSEIREERYNICKACPHFIEESKRCSECGCFMEAKTWLAADPKMLCPKQKWSR